MMIQILGLRSFWNSKKQIWQTKEDFFHRKWRANSVAEILKSPDTFLKNIPLDEQYNLYFTVANCHEMEGRQLAEQWVIPFDIDHVEEKDAKEVIFRATQAIGLTPEEVGSTFSGHGVWLFIQLEKPITGEDYFDQARNHYKAIIEKMQKNLLAHGLSKLVDNEIQGPRVDPSVWSKARIARMPNTINKKEGLPEVKAYVINSEMRPINFILEEKSGLPNVATNEQISPSFLQKYPEIDIEGVEKGCDFLKWCRAEPQNVKEYQWYGMLSVVGRFKNGKDYAHAYSKGHPKYNPHETDAKLEQALAASGPRTCKNIGALWNGCEACPNFNKVTSPILIKSAEFVRTESTGFRDVALDKDGNAKVGKPNIHDLYRYFNKKHHYVTVREHGEVMTFNGTHWVEMCEAELKNYAYNKIEPRAEIRWAEEFAKTLKIHNLSPISWFDSTTFRKINFKNGVLDLNTMQLMAHSPEFGFRYVLDYDYDVKAESPRFDSFMKEITGGVADYEQLLLEYMGYALSNDDCWAQKALFMAGSGANGKSTLCDLLRSMAAPGSHSSILSHNMEDPTYMLQFDGALFNISEETGSYSMRNVEVFKNLTSGGQLVVKRLYSQPYTIQNRAKLIFSCNDLPHVNDFSHAMFRRMIIIPFTQRFTIGENAQAGLLDIMRDERAGIFNKIILAYSKARLQNRFSETSTITSQVTAHRTNIDTVRTWFDDNFEIIPLSKSGDDLPATPKREIVSEYVEYCRSAVFEKPLNANHFWRQVHHFVPDLEERYTRKRTADGKLERFVVGIQKLSLKEEF